jgi:D-psicose/D-tagatose/L-ribulose 3-epimerase
LEQQSNRTQSDRNQPDAKGEVCMASSEYPFPLSIQITLPVKFRGQGFQRWLELLQQFGFSGVELNIVQPEQVDPLDLRAFLADHGLRMTMFASGATAKAEDLSLSHHDDQIRSASIQRCQELVDFSSELGAGIIVGFLKGGISPNRVRARELFINSLGRLEPHVRAREVPFLIEATNRYESSVANSLHDAAGIIHGFQNPYLRILPDTFHMNIEERSTFGALIRFRDLYDSLHISDNNRLFPGLGGIDFLGLLRFLRHAGYTGGIAIEGNLRDGFEEDLRACMSLLRPMLLSL